MQISRIIHTNLVCADLDKSIEFYTQVLGATLHQEADEAGQDTRPMFGLSDGPVKYRGALLYWGDSRGGPYLDLLEWEESDPDRDIRSPLSAQDRGLVRMALEVDDVVAAEKELREAGVSWVGPIHEIRVGPWMIKIVCFHDPDGTLIELAEFPYGQSRRPSAS